jgi:hypothetical protein
LVVEAIDMLPGYHLSDENFAPLRLGGKTGLTDF